MWVQEAAATSQAQFTCALSGEASAFKFVKFESKIALGPTRILIWNSGKAAGHLTGADVKKVMLEIRKRLPEAPAYTRSRYFQDISKARDKKLTSV